MIFYRPIIALVVSLLFSFCIRAQDSNYVYKDTAIFYADSVEGKSIEIPPPQNEDYKEVDEYTAPDTILTNNQLFVAADSIKKLKNSKRFAYAKNLDSLLYAYQQSQAKNDNHSNKGLSWLARFFLSPITKYFFWIVAGVFVSFILYKLFFTEGFFQRPSTTMKVSVLPDETENLSKTADYAKLIASAVGNANYRIAVRYLYLQSLQKLAAKGAIQFAYDKTNYQYMNELSGKPYETAFVSLTRHYEYVWYGEFNIDETVFNTIQNKFKQFNSGI